MADRRNVILTGFMGTGKTSTGIALARRLDREFLDTDQLIEARHGSIASIFAEQGEDAFRAIERTVAIEVGQRQGLVVATGGRMLLDPICERALSASGEVFVLNASADVIVDRVLNDSGAVRPLLVGSDPETRVRELLAERASGYRRFPPVETDGRSPEVVAEAIAIALSAPLVRRARPHDVAPVAEMLAAAFEDSVWTNWAVPAEGHHERLRRIHELHARIGVERGDLWVCVADGRVVSAAAWTFIGPEGMVDDTTVDPALLGEAQRELPSLFGDRLADLRRAERATAVARPKGRYGFLDCVGTDPTHMGHGHATRLLEETLRPLDAAGLPAGVETSTERNVEFYQRFGFTVVERFDLGGGAPPVWAMARRAAQHSRSGN